MPKPLPHSFFERSALHVARDLVGCYLVRRYRGNIQRHIITETEAYEGPRDRASHAWRGKTPRNTPMFGPAGHIYTYFVYGNHWMLNIVTGDLNYPAAVLIRSIHGVSGPGRITRRLHITGALNTKKLGYTSGLWIEKRDSISPTITRTPRVGVSYAGKIWANKLYRFIMKTA